MRAHMRSGRTRFLAAVGGLALLAGATGCYTQLASIAPQSDVTQVGPNGDSEEYYPPSRNSDRRYPEDRLYDPLYDPYVSGYSYNPDPWYRSSYGGYNVYYSTPWWYDRNYSHSGGGAPGDSTAMRRGRQLWRSDAPLPPLSTGTGSGTLIGGGSKAGASGSPTDSTTTQPGQRKDKKHSDRRLWR